MTARYCFVFVVFFGLGALMPRAVLADSDGYYCKTDQYIAYEFSFSKYSWSKHVLTVVFFDDSPGEIASMDVPLAAFQVHGMKCGADAVEVLAFDALYRIDLSSRKNQAAVKIRSFEGNINDKDINLDIGDYNKIGNISGWNWELAGPYSYSDRAKVAIIPLSAANETFKYFLHMDAYTEVNESDGGSVHNIYIHTKIVKKERVIVYDIHDIFSGHTMATEQ